ncbi:Uncharacterised protein [Streptococcus pneumoniae]|nr:Uncharacterised protein [Streptococcus pneumoniae]
MLPSIYVPDAFAGVVFNVYPFTVFADVVYVEPMLPVNKSVDAISTFDSLTCLIVTVPFRSGEILPR